MMEVVIINGSPRTNGVTAEALHIIEDGLKENGVEVEFFNLSEITMSHCIGCCSCYTTGHCCLDDDVDKINKYNNSDDEYLDCLVSYIPIGDKLTF